MRTPVRSGRYCSSAALQLTCVLFAVAPTSRAADFQRGDANQDGVLDVSDPVHVLVRLFAGPGTIQCQDAADANDDGAIDVSDAMRLLSLLFQGGAALPPPADTCGGDPTADSLDCTAFAPCAGSSNSVLSDSFDGAALDSAWATQNADLADILVAGGALTLEARTYSLWYNASEGPLIYKLASGDFKVSTTVRVRRASNPSQPPAQNIHLGGLMARNPTGGGDGPENYVFIVVGHDENDLSVETKTTRDNSSQYEGPPWPSGDAELRICRLGATFRLYKRAVSSASWALAATYARTDLPEALEVGPFIYAAQGSPDLRASFEDVIFNDVSVVEDCTLD